VGDESLLDDVEHMCRNPDSKAEVCLRIIFEKWAVGLVGTGTFFRGQLVNITQILYRGQSVQLVHALCLLMFDRHSPQVNDQVA